MTTPKDLTPTQRRNRELYPEFAAFVDEMREVFGDIQIKNFRPYTDAELAAQRKSSSLTASEPVRQPDPLVPDACRAKDSKDTRALQKQQLLKEMIASGQVKLGGFDVE